MGKRSAKVEDQNKTWVQERTSHYSRKCAPPPIVLCLTALLVLLGLLLFAVAVFFMFFWPLPHKYYDVSVQNSASNSNGWVQPVPPDPTTTPGTAVPDTTTTTTPLPTTTTPPTTTKEVTPATTSASTSTQTLTTVSATTEEVTTNVVTTITAEVTTDTPCDDMEPDLCAAGDPLTLCNSVFGKAYCCNTCQTPSSCRDLYAGCFQVWYYAQCAEGQYPSVCCATCTYSGAPP